jgi:hypothetical protein
MEDQRPPRHRPKVVCPACQGLGRNGPEGSVCRVCWLTGVIDAVRYDKIRSERSRRGDGSKAPTDTDDDPQSFSLSA